MYYVSKYTEEKHFEEIRTREEKFQNLEIHNLSQNSDLKNSVLCSQNIVIAVSQFKMMIADIINLFGGSVSSLEPVLDRARREAVLKLYENNPEAKRFVNLKVDTTNLGSGFVEAHAYATAEF